MSDTDDTDNLHKLRINADYANDYLNTKRQQLSKSKSEALQIKTDNDSNSSSSSEDEDQDGLLLTPDLDQQIQQTIDRIRCRDPAVYDPNATFYTDDQDRTASDEDDIDDDVKRPSKKPKSVRQILAEQMIDEALHPDDDPDTITARFVPVNEQARARLAFLSADANATDDDDDLELVRRPSPAHDTNDDYARFEADQNRRRAPPIDAIRGRHLSAEDQFLNEYLAGEWWKEQRPAGYIDRGLMASLRSDRRPSPADDADLSADEAFLEEQDQFEARYNFRFEEPGGTELVTHSRHIDDSVRRIDDRRARRREKRKAAKLAAKERQAEELRRAKNVRRQQLLEQAEQEERQKLQEMRQKLADDRLEAITANAGVNDGDKRAQLLAQLEGEFDADEYDRKMAAIFDDQFYDDNADDKSFVKSVSESMTPDDDDDHVPESKPNKKKRKRLDADKSSAILDELYAMDFEDTIAGGDLKTRFRYTQVPSHSFGMSLEDILNTDDKELQKRVSIKRLAPYRTDRNLKRTWQQLQEDRGARFRRKQARAAAKQQQPNPS